MTVGKNGGSPCRTEALEDSDKRGGEGLEEMANGKEIGWKGSVFKRNEGGVGIG